MSLELWAVRLAGNIFRFLSNMVNCCGRREKQILSPRTNFEKKILPFTLTLARGPTIGSDVSGFRFRFNRRGLNPTLLWVTWRYGEFVVVAGVVEDDRMDGIAGDDCWTDDEMVAVDVVTHCAIETFLFSSTNSNWESKGEFLTSFLLEFGSFLAFNWERRKVKE